MMERYELQKLRDLPIEGVAERLGLEVVRHKSLCPFHDDHHASLSFCVSRNTCRCFACMNKSMGTIDLVMRHLNLDFKQACQWLANGHAIPIDTHSALCASSPNDGEEQSFNPSLYARFFHHPFLSPEAQRFLFTERRLDPRVIRWCRITSWRDRNGIHWLQTPYYDIDGHLIGIQNRNLTTSQPQPPKTSQPQPPKTSQPYNPKTS